MSSVVMPGHSLGGALATLAALAFCKACEEAESVSGLLPVACYTFGCAPLLSASHLMGKQICLTTCAMQSGACAHIPSSCSVSLASIDIALIPRDWSWSENVRQIGVLVPLRLGHVL